MYLVTIPVFYIYHFIRIKHKHYHIHYNGRIIIEANIYVYWL
jgi:hypothetical protein